MSSSKIATDALNYAIKQIENEFKELVDGQLMIDKIVNKFITTSNSPPVQDFEFMLSKNFANDEVIVLLFQPNEDQFKYYPMFLNNSYLLPEEHPVANTHALLISLLFLIHRYSISLYIV